MADYVEQFVEWRRERGRETPEFQRRLLDEWVGAVPGTVVFGALPPASGKSTLLRDLVEFDPTVVVVDLGSARCERRPVLALGDVGASPVGPVVRVPALTDDGESFWPERFPADRLERIRSMVGAAHWERVYMGSEVG